MDKIIINADKRKEKFLMTLQDAFLNQVRTKKIPVTVHLNSGHQLRGIVRGFDAFVILLDISGKYNMVYKHAISTIMPLESITILGQGDSAADTGEEREE